MVVEDDESIVGRFTMVGGCGFSISLDELWMSPNQPWRGGRPQNGFSNASGSGMRHKRPAVESIVGLSQLRGNEMNGEDDDRTKKAILEGTGL